MSPDQPHPYMSLEDVLDYNYFPAPFSSHDLNPVGADFSNFDPATFVTYDEPQEQASPPLQPTKPASSSRSARGRPGHVPRPRNAFMIFRSEFWAEEKISATVEHDHRHISRIIGHCWNRLPDEEKDKWRRKAEQEKIEHMNRYPGYRFRPTVRTKKVVRRNVKRNGKEELLRCQQVAELLLAGKQGTELDVAVRNMNLEGPKSETHSSSLTKHSPKSIPAPIQDEAVYAHSDPVFRSPLLPPAQPEAQAHLLSPSAPAAYHGQVNWLDESTLPASYPFYPLGNEPNLCGPSTQPMLPAQNTFTEQHDGNIHYDDIIAGSYQSSNPYTLSSSSAQLFPAQMHGNFEPSTYPTDTGVDFPSSSQASLYWNLSDLGTTQG